MSMVLAKNYHDFIDIKASKTITELALAHAKSLGATQAEVGFSTSQGLSVSARWGALESVEFNGDKGFVVTVFCDKRRGNASTTDVSEAGIKAAVEAAIGVARYTEVDEWAGLADISDLATTIPECDLYHPWALSVDEAVALCLETEHYARGVDKRINNADGTSLGSHQSVYFYANSHGFNHYYPSSRHSLSCVMIAENESGMEREGYYTTSRIPSGLESARTVGLLAASKTLERLDAKKIATQEIPVIFAADVASSLFSHYLGAISGGRLYRKTSFLLDSLHRPVFSSIVNLRERPHLIQGLGSAPFDEDGVKTQDRELVIEGVNQSYLTSAYSARRLGIPNTGHAGGAHNVFVEPTHGALKELCQLMGRGLLVTDLMGNGVNWVTGDYSRGAAGLWVENGEPQYAVHEITIAGNLKTMFQSIRAIGSDVDKRHSLQTGSVLLSSMMVAGS